MHQISTVDFAAFSGVGIFAALFFATFVSEDAACITAGALVAGGNISIQLAIVACFLGILAGDLLLYWVGRVFGRGLMRFRFAGRFVSERSLDRAAAWLDDRGASAIFISRFVTGLRLPTYLVAGFLKTDFRKFALYFVLAAAVWTPLLVSSVAFSNKLFGGRCILVAAIGAFILVRVAMRLTSWRNRRLLIGRMRRVTRWEFWPLAVFYFPVVIYIIGLAIRHRSLTVFTCANPAIPAGGFVGESKDEIYSLLGSSPANQEFLLRHRLISRDLSSAARIDIALDFMRVNRLDFPIILKPDVGERGKGVRIILSRMELEATLQESDSDQVIQEFLDGQEVSIFYYRSPGANRGEIFSITEKVFPFVNGDGALTLEQLILRDERAVCLAEKYFDENKARLNYVPAAGERARIIDIGTHSRGAIFLEGERFKTPQLESVIDRICHRTEGFYFGRFDIRYTSAVGFRNGQDFKIIELNGVTSESTNIYDPRYSLIDAYRILFAQWRIAFELGARNRQLGAGITPLMTLLRHSIAALVSSH